MLRNAVFILFSFTVYGLYSLLFYTETMNLHEHTLRGEKDDRLQGLCFEDGECCQALNSPGLYSEDSGSKTRLETRISLLSFSSAFFIFPNQMAVYFYTLGFGQY
jgi:hypothetical protein